MKSKTIIWRNSSSVYNAVTISNFIVEGYTEGTANFNTDLLFENMVSNTNASFMGRGYRVTLTSVAINKGNDALVPDYITTNIAGNTHSQAGKVDMGVYESEPQEIPLIRVFVNANLTTGNNIGEDWENAFYGSTGFAKAPQYARNQYIVKYI